MWVIPGFTRTATFAPGGARKGSPAGSTTVGVEGLFAAGADAGGISTGGYASGLAAALVLGRVATESALGAL